MNDILILCAPNDKLKVLGNIIEVIFIHYSKK